MKEMNGQGTIAEMYKEISIRDVIAPVFRQSRAALLTLVAVFAIVILSFALMGSTYSSHMEILVNRERQDPMVTTEATTQMIGNSIPVTEEEINSEAELILSRDVLEQVVRANGLDKKQGFSLSDLIHPNQTEDERVARAVKKLAKKIKIKPVAKTNLIDVVYSASNPQLAHSVLQTLADAYMVKHVSVHRPSGSYQFFTTETQRYQNDLEKAEAKLRDFGKQSGTAAPDIQRTDLALQVTTSKGILHQAQQAAAADEERIRNDRQQMSNTPERSATLRSTAAADKLLDNLNDALLAAQAKRSMLAMKYEAGYPLVQEADQEVAQAKSAIAEAEKTRYVTETTDRDPTYELLREDLAKAQSDQAAQRATVAATIQSIASMQNEMVTLDRQALSQQDLLRDAKANENNYLLYLSKREQERTSDALDMKRIANVAIAVPPAIPVLPVFSWPMIFLIALGAAAVMSVATAYGLDYLDSSFHTPAQVVDMLGIPVVVGVSKKTA
jgi:uncharacterized protein involved in exopolysaccharide biosynthesis